MIDEKYREQVWEITQAAIKRGYDNARVEWIYAALEVVYDECKKRQTFNVNEIRDRVRDLEIKTHDQRAMGGIMVAAKKLGWIEATPDYVDSLVAHGIPGGRLSSYCRVWKSLIYEDKPRPTITLPPAFNAPDPRKTTQPPVQQPLL